MTCCGSSSAAAATTAARRRTASTESSTSSRRAAGAAGPKGSCPRCSGPPTGARCSPSRCRTDDRTAVRDLPRPRGVADRASQRGLTKNAVVGSLLILGFTLSLDNFRTAIALGGSPQLAPLAADRRDVRVLRWRGTTGGHPSGSTGASRSARPPRSSGRSRSAPTACICHPRVATPATDDSIAWAIRPARALSRTTSSPARAWACSGLAVVAPVFGSHVRDGAGRLQVGRAAARHRIRPDLLTGSRWIMAGPGATG